MMFFAFLRTKLGQALGFIALVLGALFAAKQTGRKEGADRVRELVEDADKKRAAKIRDAASAASERMRDHTDAGYRD